MFSGLSESGVSDLYRVRLPEGTLEPLTRDRFQDLDPSPSPDGRRLVFASDRTAGGLEGAVNLFTAGSDKRQRSPSSPGATGWTRRPPGDPTAGSTSRPTATVCSTSSRWTRWARAGGRPRPGAGRSTRSRCRTARGLLVGGFHDLSWNLYRYPVDTAARKERFSLDSGTAAGPVEPGPRRGDTAAGVAAGEPYRRRMTLDFAAGDAVFVPGYGGAQGVCLPDERSAGRQPHLRIDRVLPGPPAREHLREHQRHARST